MQIVAAVVAAVVVGTWNAKWFPSGVAEHRAAPEVEAKTIADAGRLLARGLAAVDPSGTNDVILCLNEIRGPKAARALAAAVGRTNLAMAVISGYRRRDRFDMQQDAILTTLPVAARNWSVWKSEKGLRPPRGHAHADLVLAPSVTASVYAVHLKSNYGAKSDAAMRAENRAKRGAAVRQLIAMAKGACAGGRRATGKANAAAAPVIIAGDFNADPSRAEFRDESVFADLSAAGFDDLLALLPPAARGTYPNARYGDSALDHIFVRRLGAVGSPRIVSAGGISDHNPVFVLLRDSPK